MRMSVTTESLQKIWTHVPRRIHHSRLAISTQTKQGYLYSGMVSLWADVKHPEEAGGIVSHLPFYVSLSHTRTLCTDICNNASIKLWQRQSLCYVVTK